MINLKRMVTEKLKYYEKSGNQKKIDIYSMSSSESTSSRQGVQNDSSLNLWIIRGLDSHLEQTRVRYTFGISALIVSTMILTSGHISVQIQFNVTHMLAYQYGCHEVLPFLYDGKEFMGLWPRLDRTFITVLGFWVFPISCIVQGFSNTCRCFRHLNMTV